MKEVKVTGVNFYRTVTPGFSEYVETTVFTYTTKHDLIKQVREQKKKISSKCVYKTTGDIIRYEMGVDPLCLCGSK